MQAFTIAEAKSEARKAIMKIEPRHRAAAVLELMLEFVPNVQEFAQQVIDDEDATVTERKKAP